MAANDTVTSGMVVTLRYTVRGSKSAVLERSDGDSYVHGAGAIPRGLERALEGKKLGDRLTVSLTPEEAYGPKRRGPGPQPVPRSTFPDDVELKPGMQFSAESPSGQPVTLYVVRIEPKEVFVDTNHPWAGQSLEYELEITAIRPVSDKE